MDFATVNATSSALDDPESYPNLGMAIVILNWAPLVAASVGIAANFLTYLTADQLQTRKSGEMFIKAAACADTSNCFVLGFVGPIDGIPGKGLEAVSNYWCKTNRYLSLTSGFCG